MKQTTYVSPRKLATKCERCANSVWCPKLKLPCNDFVAFPESTLATDIEAVDPELEFQEFMMI